MKERLKCGSYIESQNCLDWKIPLRPLRPTFDQSRPYQIDQRPECRVQSFLESLGMVTPAQYLSSLSVKKFFPNEATCKTVFMQYECAGAWADFGVQDCTFETGFKGLTWQICVT